MEFEPLLVEEGGVSTRAYTRIGMHVMGAGMKSVMRSVFFGEQDVRVGILGDGFPGLE